ncbi:hypothetical protein OHB12_33025 [Nocardia sp. NBC_01730]|uniref:hypothetical protein n=1 Tax=Nocardia sp. NBC_01730 TaxID=2975998 RepID=UPI002E1174D1|nr:hypothetical protein OHB12_33025 [Nocardia sp. NBC_01730]
MTSGRVLARVAVPTAVTAVMSTGLAVAVNYATGGDHSLWMWIAVAVLTVGVFAASLWTQSAQYPTTGGDPAARGILLRKIKSQGGLRADGVRSTGTAVEVDGGHFGGDMEFKNITGGDASHP